MMSRWATLKDRAAGRWQIPLLVVSLALLAGAFMRVRPAPTKLPPEQALKHLSTLVSGELYDRAIKLADLLLVGEKYAATDRAAVHLQLGRARYGRALHRSVRTSVTGRQILEHYQHAVSHAQRLTSDDYRNMGRAFEWQQQFDRALEQYEKALELGFPQPLDLRKHMLSLILDKMDTPPERSNELVDRFLAEVGDDRLDLILWATERKLDLLEALGRLDEATTLLTRYRESFQSSDLHDRFAYLEAWLLYKAGHFDEAETHLRAVRNRVEREDETYAMTGWLLGRVVMADGGPQRPAEALSFFQDVIVTRAGTPYGVASRIGAAEALAMLERHGEATDAYRIAIEELESLGPQRLVNREVLRTSLGVMADGQRQLGRLGEAVDYAQLAVALVDSGNIEQTVLFLQQLAQAQSMLAAQLDGQSRAGRGSTQGKVQASSRAARDMFAQAASTYLELAQITALNERLAADTSWRAAEGFARAGERERAAKLYQSYAKERPQHPLVPRALLRIGQLRQALGQLMPAIEAYQECYRRFPRTLDGSRALVPLARCYLAMGSDYEDLAEKTLLIVLEDSEVFTPEAPEFSDALFLLGDALNRRGSYERAIATLEEMLERYPDDERVWRARYLLADSYRKSGLALKGEVAKAKFAGEIEQIRAESTERFRAAQRLYRRLMTEYERRDPATRNRLAKVYLRHAHLYEADCYFETQDYRHALKLYEEAAGMYKDSPSALAAYTQIVNSHVFLGEPEEARAALVRALVLVDAIPEEAFDRSVSPEKREDWKRYLQWLGRSELF